MERAADAVNVGAMVSPARVLGLFGGHVVDGPHAHAALDQPVAGSPPERVGRLDDSRRSQVENPHIADGIEHQIAQLDVTMNDPVSMGRLEPRAAWIRHSTVWTTGNYTRIWMIWSRWRPST